MQHRRRITILTALILLVFAVGTWGFYWLSRIAGIEPDLLDCLYQTIITVSTLGSREIHALQATWFIANAVEHFIHRPIAARGNNHFESFPHSRGGQRAARARGLRRFYGALRGKGRKMMAKMPRLVAASHRVEDDAAFHEGRRIPLGGCRPRHAPAAPGK